LNPKEALVLLATKLNQELFSIEPQKFPNPDVFPAV
jgi:hypothetical protein